MRIEYIQTPFPHAIIDDFFTKEQYEEVNNEIQVLKTSQNNYFDNDRHHSTLESYNIKTWDLDNFYKDDRSKSAILNYTKQVMFLDYSLQSGLSELYKLLRITNYDVTYVHSYGNGATYPEHYDAAILSFLFFVWDEPKKFTGGDLYFPLYDYKPTMTSNSVFIFGGTETHTVTEVKDCDGYNRNIINRRVHLKPELV
jgi:hypothetical protein